MKLVLEIIPHTGDEQVTHRVIEQFPLTVGRSFNNDVILSDPHISPQHLRIGYEGEQWTVTDLGSANGFSVNGTHAAKETLPLKSGDTLRIGHTELRLFAPHHPVTEAVRLQKAHPVYAWLNRPFAVWGCFFIAFAVLQGWAYLEIWTEEIKMVLAGTAAATAGSIMLWATLWSVAGRLIRRKPHFKSHLTIASLYLIAAAATWYVEAYTDFLTNENWVAAVVSYGIHFILLTLLLQGSLALATRMTERRRRIAGIFFAAGILLGVFSLSLISARNFTQQPLYPATLEPYLSQFAPADTLDEFMAGNEKVFADQ